MVSMVSIFPMSDLDPFTIKSLRQMREELVDMQKSELTLKSLNDLLPKYRDGLVASGFYNSISQMQSGQQYVTDVDQLDAVRFETIKMMGAAIVAVDSKQIVQTILEEYLPRVTDTKLATLLDEFNAIKERAPNLAAIGYRTILSHLIQEQAKAAKPDSELAKKEDLFPSDAIRAAIKEKFFQEAETKLIWNFEKNGQKAVFDNITHKAGANTLIEKSGLSSAVDMLNKLLPIVYPKGPTE